jgi:DNA-binding transcriptional LysR family regulator
MMYAEAPDVPPGKILDISLKRLHSLRRSVFKDIVIEARRAPNLIVNTHATFRWRHGLFPAVDFDQMRQLNADMYVCLIDGVAAILELVADGAGSAVLSMNAVATSGKPAAFSTRPIHAPRLRSKLSLAVSARRPATLTQQAMLELIRQTAGELLEPRR